MPPSSKAPSERRTWADQLGIAFHEVLVEANSQTIGLVFSEATVAEVTPGYVPFIVAPGVTPKPTPRASICRED